MSEPGFDCSERWSPERTFVLAKKAAGGSQGFRSCLSRDSNLPPRFPLKWLPLFRSNAVFRDADEVVAGLVAPCCLAPWFPRRRGHLRFCWFLAGGWSSTAQQSNSHADFYMFESFPQLGAEAALQKWKMWLIIKKRVVADDERGTVLILLVL